MLLESGKPNAPAEMGAQQERAGDALGEQRLLVKGCWRGCALVAFAWWALGAELRGKSCSRGEQSTGHSPGAGDSQLRSQISFLIPGNFFLYKAESFLPSQGGGRLSLPTLGSRSHAWGLPGV